VARALNAVLGHDQLRHALSINGQKRASDHFLVHTQMESWIRYALCVMGITRPQIRRTQSAPDIMSLPSGGLAAMGGGGTRRHSAGTSGASLPESLSVAGVATASGAGGCSEDSVAEAQALAPGALAAAAGASPMP
jgi:hypothetical protein